MPVLHLHSEGGVNTVVEVQIGGAVVGSVCNSQVTVSDPTVQLLLYTAVLQDTASNVTGSIFINKEQLVWLFL